MPSSKTYDNATETIWQCVKSKSESEHGTRYDCSDSAGDNCTATTDTPVGQVQLKCVEDPAANTLTYTIVKKPGIVPESAIWNGAESTLRECGWRG
ncbi:MAG: hypothetical protein M3323_03165 [Actinomycetota bacterium]|nr:hypothetical protein [Actinomycetota bacterium]